MDPLDRAPSKIEFTRCGSCPKGSPHFYDDPINFERAIISPMKTIFEWDEAKARINFEKHKVSFDEASTIFLDPFLITFVDDFHSDQEERFISIGLSEKNRV